MAVHRGLRHGRVAFSSAVRGARDLVREPTGQQARPDSVAISVATTPSEASLGDQGVLAGTGAVMEAVRGPFWHASVTWPIGLGWGTCGRFVGRAGARRGRR